MEIRQLRRFLVLAEELHFGHAAERLHIAQPALSQELKALEGRLGLRLFDRNNRSVALTEAGRRLVVEASEVVERFDAAIAVMTRIRADSDSQLRLGVSVGVDQALLSKLLGAAIPDSVETEVIVSPASAIEGLKGLGNGELDAAFIHVIPESSRELQFQILAREEFGVAAPAASVLAAKKAVRAADLSGQPTIWLQRDGDAELCARILRSLTDAGMTPGPQRKSPSIDTSLSLVAAGLGVAFKLSREVPRDSHRGVIWRPLSDVSLPLPTTLVWRSDNRSPLVARLVDEARRFQWPA